MILYMPNTFFFKQVSHIFERAYVFLLLRCDLEMCFSYLTLFIMPLIFLFLYVSMFYKACTIITYLSILYSTVLLAILNLFIYCFMSCLVPYRLHCVV